STTIRWRARIGSNGSSTSFTPVSHPTTQQLTAHHRLTAQHPMTSNSAAPIHRIVDAIRTRKRFVLSSHSRPDGDSIGSQLAMAYALAALGKEAIAVNADPA